MAGEARHKAQTIIEGLHAAISFEYADEDARLAGGPFEAYDKNKFALQLDGYSIWVLVDTVAETWVQITQGNLSDFLRVDGTVPMQGNLSMDGYNIISVGLVDGVDVSAHAARHESGGADEIDGYQLALVYSPSNYTPPASDVLGEHIAAIDIALAAAGGGDVPSTRNLTAGAGLTGGGDLSADRTFDVVANADGSIVVNANDIQVGTLATDGQHGNLGGGSLHDLANSITAGFFSSDGYNKLAGIEDGAEANVVTSVFSRTGDVVAAVSDYSASQVDNDSTVTGTFVSDALDYLDGYVTSTTSLLLSHATRHEFGGADPLEVANLSTTDTNTAHVLKPDGAGGVVWGNVSGGGGGSGNVSGPEITTDNALVRWDGTDGYYIQNSGIIIDDSDNITGAGTFNGVTVENHSARHESGGADAIDGYQLSLVYTPTNYVAPASNIIGLHIEAIDEALATAGDVPSTRNLTAGAGLTGGGDLSADRTFDVVANADGSIVVNADDIQVGVLATDGQHGTRGGGTLHALATASTAGFFSADGYNKLAGIEDGAEVNVVTSVFSRTGDVTAAASDYDASQVDNDSTVSGAFVSDALDYLDGYIGALYIHASRHESGGADAIDGYQLAIVYAPTNYNPPAADILGLHIEAIDEALSASGAVTSVFTRTGNIVAVASDYDASQIDNDSGVPGTFVSDALDYLDGYVVHAARHISGAADEIDGDRLDIDWNPSNYTPTTDPTEVTSVDHLTAHLAGIDSTLGVIDVALTNIGDGYVVGPAVALNNAVVRYDGTSGKLVKDSTMTVDDGGSVVITGNLLVDGIDNSGSNITNVGLINGIDIAAHASRHESGGGDAIDGYQIALTYAPANYTAPASDILGLHIEAIDDQLGTIVTDHGSLAGLADDDHTQYLLVDGTRAMSGNLDLDGYNIVNVGTVDGVDVSAHASRHESGGADAIDGYQIAIVYAPINYAAPVDDVIGEHLAAIDTELGTIVTDHGGLTGLGDDDHTQYLLVDGTRAMTGTLDMGTFAITNVGNVDGVDVSAHAARHEFGGADAIDGYQLGISYTPTNWDAPSSDVLGLHLYEIDLTLNDVVIGPSSATDNALARYDGATGKLIQNSDAILNDDGYLVLADGLAVGGDIDALGYTIVVGEGVDVANAYQISKEPSGFPDRTTSTMSINDGSLEFTIAPVSVSFDFYLKGVKYTKTGPESVNWTNVEGIHFFGYTEEGVLTHSVSEDDVIAWIGGDGAFVSAIYWDFIDARTIYWNEERHGLMPGPTHTHFHTAFGTQWISGGQLTSIIADGSGDLDSHVQFGVTTFTVADEDIVYTAVDGYNQVFDPIAYIPIYYRTGASANWRKKDADEFPIIQSGTAGYTGASGRAAYNEYTGATWQLTEVSNGDFFLVHYYGSTEINEPFFGVLGQAIYGTVGQARTGATTEINSIGPVLRELSKEFKVFATVIYQTSNTYANAVQTRIRSTDEGDDYVDFRGNPLGGGGASSGGVTDHGNLTGLADDDHTQYLLVSGTRAMTGALDMGTFAITNVGNVDGVDVSTHATRHQNGGADEISVAGLSGLLADAQTPTAHASTHLSGQADEIDGYQLALVYSPTNYTAPTNNVVGEHIYRIDDELGSVLGSIITDHGLLTGLGDDDHPQYLLADGTRTMSGNLDMDGYNIVNVGTVDGVTVSAHASRHEFGGADAIDGYQLAVTYSPVNYSAPSSDVLGQHLYEIDQALGGIVLDHGTLTGLGDDDHTQYLLADGTRAMSGNLDMGGFDISNAGDGYFNGKLTVTGLIDPTGMVLELQSTVPGGTPDAGKATIWVRDTDGYAILTDENGIDTVLSAGGGGGGSGNVVGPASATDLALVRFDGTTGKLIQDSDAVLDDNGNLTLAGYILATDGYFSNSVTADGDVTVNGQLDVYSDGYFAQNLEIAGKLTVGDLIDPTGIVLDLQSTVPGGTPAAGKSTLWVNTDGYAILTDEFGNDVVIGTVTSGEGTPPKYFDAYDTTGGTAVANNPSWTDVPLDTERVKDDIYTHSTVSSNPEVTITEAGTYLVMARVSTQCTSGTTRDQSFIQLVLDTGSGYAVVDGTAGIMYNRQFPQGGTSASVQAVMALSAGDKLKIQVQQELTTNAVVLLADGSGLVIVKIPSAASGVAAHAETHILGGSDPITGNSIYLNYSPTNYPAPASNTIGAHIQKLDAALSSTIAVDTINLDGYDIVNIGTATFSDWPTITSDGYGVIPFDGYQKATLDLNDQSAVEITLNEPNGPGNFMLILKQGSSTATTTFTWVAENGYDIYAPSGAITVATDTSSRTMVGLAFDGTDWYVASTQPMQVVT